MSASTTGHPKRILYVCPVSERAGAEQVTKSLLLQHDRRHWHAELVFFREGPFVQEMRELGFQCHIAKSGSAMRMRNPFSVLRLIDELSTLMRDRKIDLVHSVMGYGHVIGGLAARKAGLPELWFQHGPTGPLDYLTGLIPSEAIIVNSKSTLQRQKRYHSRTGSLPIVYPGLDALPSLEIIENDGQELRRKIWGQNDVFVFGIMGRMARMKGQADFVAAASRLLKNESSVRFVLIGASFQSKENSYMEEVRRLIDQSPYPDRFYLTGFLANPKPALSSCDAIVNASVVSEPFGLAVVEALQLGKPVIAPNEGGPAEIFTDGSEGLLFKPRDQGDLTRAMRDLMTMKKNPAQWSRICEAAKLRASRHFTAEKMTQEIEDIYAKVLTHD